MATRILSSDMLNRRRLCSTVPERGIYAQTADMSNIKLCSFIYTPSAGNAARSSIRNLIAVSHAIKVFGVVT